MTPPPLRLRSFLSAYALLIALGATLLLLPGVTATEALTLFDALFTSVSAVCLVGLTVVDTATYFTLLGQSIVLLLIQLGIVLYLFFAVHTVRAMGREEPPVATDGTGHVLGRIVGVTVLIEVGAFGLIFYAWGGESFGGVGRKLFVSIFHAVSAFGNAGFSVLDDNLYTVQRAFVLHLVVLATFVLGGLGIDTLYDLFSRQRLRQRLANPIVDWRPDTKVIVNGSMVLLGVGTVAVYLLEQGNALSELNLTEKLVGSLFQSATTRTAGFYTVDISALAAPTLFVMIVLMLIGGGAGSTAGGIKINTLYRAVSSRSGEYGRRIRRAARGVVGYALVVNGVGVLALWFIEPGPPLVALVFEQVSAFSSVGLSYVGTEALSWGGQVVILLSMLLGRVGVLALMMSLSAAGRAR